MDKYLPITLHVLAFDTAIYDCQFRQASEIYANVCDLVQIGFSTSYMQGYEDS